MKRLHFLQHVSFEGLGSIADWASRKQISVSRSRLYQDDPIPLQQTYDLLVIMGGPMGVDESQKYPWLLPEMNHIQAAIEQHKKILGICLGAQLLAHVLGAQITTNPHREIGWFPVRRTPLAQETMLKSVFPAEINAFHWHGQTFEIPSGATHLASSDACHHQAFCYDDHIIALQYHLETTPEAAKTLISNCGNEMTPSPSVQTAEEILESPDRFTHINSHMTRLLDYLNGR